MLSVKYALSVIVPFRCENKESFYLFERLKNLIENFKSADDLPIEFIVVDSGSIEKYQIECKDFCNKNNIIYLYHDSVGKPFSIGACRDYGVVHARGKAVSFLDVDLRVSSDYWVRLLNLMQAWGISKYKKSFLAVPCLYLTQEGTIDFLERVDDLKFIDIYMRYLQGDKVYVESFALCSSVMIVDRIHYLSVGGHDPEFQGHGYEDFELYHRLLCEENIIPKADDYYRDQKTWDTYTYKGFRSHLSIVARPALMANLFVVHLWHPRPKNLSFYSSEKLSKNRNIWIDKFKKFATTGEHPNSLTAVENFRKVLFFGFPNSNSSACLRNVFPLIGEVIYINEYDFLDKQGNFSIEDFESMLSFNSIDLILFPNPYGNEVRLKIYEWSRKTGFPFYCYERGALPDSWFFDSKGCNADSESYCEKYWNQPLSSEQIEVTKRYIQHCIYGSTYLEKQGEQIGALALSSKLKIGGKKVLFVPLQRPSDTVIKYMIGNAQSYFNFIKVIDKLAERLQSLGWVVLCKKHPSETEVISLKYAKYVDEDTNFIDLLDLADRVALINSGVGVYSAMMRKPCYIFGEAFYQFDGVNKRVESINFEEDEKIDILAKDILLGFDVDYDKCLRFINYLISDFYSFGKAKTKIRKEPDGSLRTITTSIDFYKFNLDGKNLYEYEQKDRPKINNSSPLFERYGLDIHMKKRGEVIQKNDIKPQANNLKKVESIPFIKADAVSIVAEGSVNKVLNEVKSHVKTKEEIRRAKLNKFKRDPYKFCFDSKNPITRACRVFFKKK